MDLNDIELKGVNSIYVAQDRYWWRTVLKEISLRVPQRMEIYYSAERLLVPTDELYFKEEVYVVVK